MPVKTYRQHFLLPINCAHLGSVLVLLAPIQNVVGLLQTQIAAAPAVVGSPAVHHTPLDVYINVYIQKTLPYS